MKSRLCIVIICLLHTVSWCGSPLEYAINNLSGYDRVTLYHFIKGFIESNPSQDNKLNIVWKYADKAYQAWLKNPIDTESKTLFSEPWLSKKLYDEIRSDKDFKEEVKSIMSIQNKEVVSMIQEKSKIIDNINTKISQEKIIKKQDELQTNKTHLLIEIAKAEQQLIAESIAYNIILLRNIVKKVEDKVKDAVCAKIWALNKIQVTTSARKKKVQYNVSLARKEYFSDKIIQDFEEKWKARLIYEDLMATYYEIDTELGELELPQECYKTTPEQKKQIEFMRNDNTDLWNFLSGFDTSIQYNNKNDIKSFINNDKSIIEKKQQSMLQQLDRLHNNIVSFRSLKVQSGKQQQDDPLKNISKIMRDILQDFVNFNEKIESLQKKSDLGPQDKKNLEDAHNLVSYSLKSLEEINKKLQAINRDLKKNKELLVDDADYINKQIDRLNAWSNREEHISKAISSVDSPLNK